MTNVKIVYNPIQKAVQLFYENKEITSKENKVYAFLQSMGLQGCLLPFNRRYIIWRGLLAELVSEFNDAELHIVFEGRERDFKEVEKSFADTSIMVENIGYDNHWHLSFVRNFDAENLADKLISIADSIRDICETKNELYEITGFMKHITQENIAASHQKLQEILEGHLEKWNNSTDKYKKSKIDVLMMKKAELDEVWNYISGLG